MIELINYGNKGCDNSDEEGVSDKAPTFLKED